ncbi:hypothetical protein HDU76_002168 [Blyttiomyces sp. JEL0837]|nr:hypothetical protein HDU76_002168 [Blyttiomyces sp. JEL0837]
MNITPVLEEPVRDQHDITINKIEYEPTIITTSNSHNNEEHAAPTTPTTPTTIPSSPNSNITITMMCVKNGSCTRSKKGFHKHNLEGGGNGDEIKRKDKLLLRKMDTRLLPLLFILYFSCVLDRMSIGNAKLVNVNSTGIGDLEQDLGMSNEWMYTGACSIFFIGYVIFEVASNNMLKYFTPSRWLARIMVTRGVFAVVQAFTTNFAQLMVLRFLLGAFESGFFPGVVFYLTFWYRKQELAWRLGVFFTAYSIAGSIEGILSYYLSQTTLGMLQSWRSILFWENVPSIILGIITWHHLPDHPSSTLSASQFLSKHEKARVVKRLEVDGVDTRIGYELVWREVWESCVDFKVHILSSKYHQTTWIFEAQLHTIPPYLISILSIQILTQSSDTLKDRSLHLLPLCTIGSISFFMLSFYHTTNPYTVHYWITCLAMLSILPAVPISLSWLCSNVNGQTRTATSIALMVSFGNLAGVLVPVIYQHRESHVGESSESSASSTCGSTVESKTSFETKVSIDTDVTVTIKNFRSLNQKRGR